MVNLSYYILFLSILTESHPWNGFPLK